MKMYAKTALALGVVMAMSAAQAANLGQLRVDSRAGQNFSATFVVEGTVQQGTSLTARLAPEEVYTRHHMTMPESAKGLNLALIKKNPLTLRIAGTKPAVERAFPLLVELNEGGQVTLRQYNIHLGATGSVEPVAVQTNAPVRATQPAVAAASVDPVAQALEQSKKETKVATKPATKEAQSLTPLQRMQARNYDLDEPITVEAGYTPWSLGVLYQKRYPGATVNQVLVALAVHNPEAFPAGNVQQLKSGAKISAPPASLVDSINAQTAREIVQKGLNIEEVSKRPMPIAQGTPAEHKKSVAQAARAQKPTQPKPAVVDTPVVQPPVAPVDQLAQEQAPTDSQAVPPTTQPALPDAAPVETPPQMATEPASEQVLPPDTSIVTDSSSAQDSMPTLEIMTEEEPVVEEESSSWPWYLLIAAMLGAAGFIFWRTKRGRHVDFQSFKRVMNQAPATRREPVAGTRQGAQTTQSAQTIQGAPSAQSVAQSQRVAQSATSAPEVKQHASPSVFERPSAPERVEPTFSTTQVAAATSKPTSPEDTTGNVFDLVSDDTSVTKPVTDQVAAQTQAANPAQSQATTSNMKDSLDMARSFISIGARSEAVSLLQEVLRNGSALDRAEAEQLLKQVREHA